ncbi:hypothetical protein B0H13DRAFT_1926346 [Mycena leptocephala]|nr:hypothetical protein B0H13DRAFT_1926346 [Mycena leptocephala]
MTKLTGRRFRALVEVENRVVVRFSTGKSEKKPFEDNPTCNTITLDSLNYFNIISMGSHAWSHHIVAQCRTKLVYREANYRRFSQHLKTEDIARLTLQEARLTLTGANLTLNFDSCISTGYQGSTTTAKCSVKITLPYIYRSIQFHSFFFFGASNLTDPLDLVDFTAMTGRPSPLRFMVENENENLAMVLLTFAFDFWPEHPPTSHVAAFLFFSFSLYSIAAPAPAFEEGSLN